jgi:copper chaperone
MIHLKVSGMTCGGCIKAITNAIMEEDQQAQVTIDLATQGVDVQSTLDPQQIKDLITDAGFLVMH